MQVEKMFHHTVPSSNVCIQASKWLLEERGYKFVIEAETEGRGNSSRYTGRYTFKFLCEQEYMWFLMRWA
jgi:hypothetical protein